MRLVGDEIRITTKRQALKRVRELAAPYKPAVALASDQLIKARHKEAAREDDELGGFDMKIQALILR